MLKTIKKSIFKNILKWIWVAKPHWKLNKNGKPKAGDKELVRAIIQEEFKELCHAMQVDDRNQVKDGVIDLIYTACNAAALYGIDHHELYDFYEKVSTSNWSKYCDTEDEAIDTMLKYASGMHPNKIGKSISSYYLKQGDKYIVYRSSDKKIMKSYLFVGVENVG